MSNLDAIYSDIQSLRGANVRVFGQPTTLSTEVPELCIDALDVIDLLRPEEVFPFVAQVYKEELDDYEEVEFEDIDEYMNYMEDELGVLKETGSDNSYNWSSPVSNDFYFHTYEMDTGETLIRIAFHRYGDVRGNYTTEALLKYRSFEHFAEVLMEANRYIDYKGYEVNVDIFKDTCEVYKNGEYVKSICDLDELDEEEEEVEQGE